MATLKIGDYSRDGLLQLTDTSWDSNGTLLTVTVREMIGGIGAWNGGWDTLRPKMRRFARRAIHHPERTRSARMLRTWYAQGCQHATFAVSRLERDEP